MALFDERGRAPVPPSRKFRRALRLAGWNALLLIVGAALVVAAGEVYLRLTVPFMTSNKHHLRETAWAFSTGSPRARNARRQAATSP